MSDVSWQTFTKWAIIILACLALLVGMVWGMVEIDSSGGVDEQATEQAIAHACDPMENTGVDYHGSGWNERSRYEVTCSDGSQRIVYPK